MISTPEARAWLTDQCAIARTIASMEKAARDHKAMPAVSQLVSVLAAAEADGAEAVLALARSFIRDDAILRSTIAAAVESATADPFFRPPLKPVGSAVHTGLLLFSEPALTVQLAVMSAEALAIKRAYRTGGSSIIFTGRHSTYRFLDPGGATISIWQTAAVGADFTLAQAPPCRLRERRLIGPGETLDIDGRSETFIIDHAPRDIVFVQASIPLGAGPLAVEYDSVTLEAVGTSSTDDASSRTRMMLALLRIMDRQDAAPVFRDAARREHFYGRWEAMRELVALDPEAALPELRKMAVADQHPEVRAAAAHTLVLLTGGEEGETEPCLS